MTYWVDGREVQAFSPGDAEEVARKRRSPDDKRPVVVLEIYHDFVPDIPQHNFMPDSR